MPGGPWGPQAGCVSRGPSVKRSAFLDQLRLSDSHHNRIARAHTAQTFI